MLRKETKALPNLIIIMISWIEQKITSKIIPTLTPIYLKWVTNL